jgi:DNA-binding XRE family transcriptional regulator
MKTIAVKAEEIRRLRIINGYSIRGLAKQAAVDPVTVHKIEAGKSSPNPSTAKKICDALNVEFNQLFEIVEEGA